jgi:hypothetical protein
MGTRHLYWILTGPSFTVCVLFKQSVVWALSITNIKIQFLSVPENKYLIIESKCFRDFNFS